MGYNNGWNIDECNYADHNSNTKHSQTCVPSKYIPNLMLNFQTKDVISDETDCVPNNDFYGSLQWGYVL